MYWSHTHEAGAVYAHTTPLTPAKFLERMAHAHQFIVSSLSHILTPYQDSISKIRNRSEFVGPKTYTILKSILRRQIRKYEPEIEYMKGNMHLSGLMLKLH